MLRHRLLTALLLGGLFLAALFLLPPLAWALFLLLFIAIGAWEWGALAGYASAGRRAFLGLVLLLALPLLPGSPLAVAVQQGATLALYALSALFWLLLAPLWLRYRWPVRAPWISVPTGLLLLLPPWLALLQLRTAGAGLTLAAMAAVWLADSAAYFCGKRYGRHKLAPAISPGKTWEGLAGALFAVVLATAALCAWLKWPVWLPAGAAAIVLLSVLGDLFESLIKRQAGMKDSGSLLPGHGGVLDRIDGLTSTLPLVALAAILVQLTS